MNKPAMLAMLLTPAALFADPSVERVIVRQQWPWSTDVKVEYSLSGVGAAHPVDISVRAFNDGVELPSANLDAAITGDRYGITDAVGSLTIDPVKAFGTEQVALGSFTVQLSLSASSANMDDILYKIVDLVPDANNNYAVTDVRRKDFYNGKYQDYVTSFSDIDSSFSTSLDPADVLIWRGVTNDIYKTDKMVFRRIPAAGKSFQFQKGIEAATNAYYAAGEGIKVSFTKDFYIAVFEITQQQFLNLTTTIGWTDFYCRNETYRRTRPADQFVHYWTANNKQSACGSTWGAVTYALNQKISGLNGKVGLPTEAMWEYACRAGTDTFKYSGETGTLSADDGFSVKVQRALTLNGDGNSGPSQNCGLESGSLTVGILKPNAWGLYDMLGNVREWCKDRNMGTANLWKCACYSQEDNIDPEGPTAAEVGVTDYSSDSDRRVLRGGAWGTWSGGSNFLTYGSMGRVSQIWRYNDRVNGVRPCIYAD